MRTRMSENRELTGLLRKDKWWQHESNEEPVPTRLLPTTLPRVTTLLLLTNNSKSVSTYMKCCLGIYSSIVACSLKPAARIRGEGGDCSTNECFCSVLTCFVIQICHQRCLPNIKVTICPGSIYMSMYGYCTPVDSR